VIVTDPELTLAVKVPRSAPPASCTDAVQDPVATGDATTVHDVDDTSVAAEKVTIVVLPDVQVPNVMLVVGAGSVTAIVWS
jgi:hypothetical protein